jgi:hypothetical protein
MAATGWDISGRFPVLQWIIGPFFILLLWWIRKKDERNIRRAIRRRMTQRF